MPSGDGIEDSRYFAEDAKHERLSLTGGGPVIVRSLVDQAERWSECGIQSGHIIAADRQAAASLGTVRRERSQDEMSAGRDRTFGRSAIALPIRGVGKEVKHGAVLGSIDFVSVALPRDLIEQMRQLLLDEVPNLVAHSAIVSQCFFLGRGRCRQPRRIIEPHMHYAGSPQERRTVLVRVPADSHDQIKGDGGERIGDLGRVSRQIDSRLTHHTDRVRVHAMGRDTGRKRFEAGTEQVSSPAFRHLAATGIPCAEKQNLEFLHKCVGGFPAPICARLPPRAAPQQSAGSSR